MVDVTGSISDSEPWLSVLVAVVVCPGPGHVCVDACNVSWHDMPDLRAERKCKRGRKVCMGEGGILGD